MSRGIFERSCGICLFPGPVLDLRTLEGWNYAAAELALVLFVNIDG